MLDRIIAGVQGGLYSTETYVDGIQAFVNVDSHGLYYALTKSVVFAFILTAIPSYYGYYTRGGALEVGRSSTKAVVASSVAHHAATRTAQQCEY